MIHQLFGYDYTARKGVATTARAKSIASTSNHIRDADSPSRILPAKASAPASFGSHTAFTPSPPSRSGPCPSPDRII